MRFDSIKKENNFKESVNKLKSKYTANVSLSQNAVPSKMDNLWVESTAPNVLENKNVDVKPLNIKDFISDVKTNTKDRQNKIEQDILKAGYKSEDFTDEEKKMLLSGEYSINPTYTPESKYAKKIVYSGKWITQKDIEELNKNAPLSQKIDKAIKYDIPTAIKKTGNTVMDLGANVVTGATNAFEGMADAAVGNLGAVASGVTSGFGLAPNSLSEKIKKGAEDFVKFNFSGEEILEEKKNEGAGIYEPKILGMKVRDGLNTISNMITSVAFGGPLGFTTSAAGQNIEEALLDNQSLNRAVVYGDVAGAIEGLTEKMFDAVKLLGGGKFDKFLPKGAIAKLIGGAGGEAIEEVISDGINPFLKYLTYEKGTYDMPSLTEYLNILKEAARNGFVLGLIMKGGQDVTSPQIREQYKEEIYTAVDKSKLPDNIKEIVKEVMTTPAQAQINQDLQNLRNQNPQTPNTDIQLENVKGLPKIEAQNQTQNVPTQQPNVTLPKQAEMPQNANMEQITQTPNLPTQKAQKTLQSAKIAGMTDVDMQKAIDLNKMLRSGANLEFYDPKNIPQGVDVERATDANGFYMNGTLWINKNSDMKVQKILGHELTHYAENDDLVNTILDSNIFYDFLAEKGFNNAAEFKTYLKEKKGYKQEELTSEMVAHFAEEKLFGKEETINRLARENRTLAQKILNWISDLKTKIAGSTEAKELLRIENMYRKALDQARETSGYSNGEVLMSIETIPNTNKRYVKATRQVISGENPLLWETQVENYINEKIRNNEDVNVLAEDGTLLTITKDTAGKAKFRNDVIDKNGNKRKLNNKEFSAKLRAETHIDELAQVSKMSKDLVPDTKSHTFAKDGFTYRTAYFEDADGNYYKITMSVGKNGDINTIYNIGRMNKAQKNKSNSVRGLKGPSGETTSDRIASNNSINQNDSSVNTQYAQESKNDTAGKEPAFSMPETDNQGRTLSKEQQEFFKDSKVRDDNGKLLEVYHGTDAEEFTVFDKELSDEDNVLGQGLYFTADKTQGQKYGSKIYTTYLNIKNPFVIKDLTTHALANEIAKENPNADIIDTDYGVASTAKMTDYLIDNGYDGIKAGENVYVAFEPNQIKNVDNTNPTSNPDIRYSVNPAKKENKTKTRMLSRYAQTLQNKHEDIPEQINLIQKEVDNGNFTHEVIHDKRSLNYAQKYIEDNGFDDAVKHWDELIKRGKPVDKDELALGQMIYNVAVDNKDTRLVMKMASDLVQEYTEIGRNLQSATLLRKMTPDGKLYALERSVQKINQDLMQKFDNFENIQIPEELADKLLRSETQKDMDTAVEQIQEYIASKIPATWQEKLNSWRYLAMLGNPRTHIRNIVGNAVFIPAVEMKNALAQVGELTISKDQRTKSFVTSFNKKDAKLLKYAENDFDNNRKTIRGENKYDIRTGVQEKRTIYSWKALEAARKGNFNLLEAEDTLFLKYRYKKAFAGALKARGITIEQLRENSPETIKKVSEIRNYAINEAQKATYRDASKVAAMVSSGKRKLLNAANQSTGAAKLGYNLAYLGAEGVIPFAKTPINIVKRGIEYSPAGLLNGIKNAVFDVKSGKVTAAQAIDKIAAGATGTAIAGLGFFLASIGLVSGGEEEKDKEQALKQLKGNQDYSLKAFGKSYTIDWSAPSSIPLFIGVELYNSITSEDESAYLNALSNMAEPVVEMSMLQGLNDTLTTLGQDSAIGNIVGKTLMNYLGQYNPTLFGQIARSFDPVRRTTYVDKNISVPAAAQRFLQQQAAKIPGVSRMLPTYKDQFGQEQITDGVINRIVQNFFSPGYLKDIKEGTVEQGLTELYEKTGETSVIPSYASKTLTQGGKKINLTAKQYDTYAKTRGDISKKGLEGLFKDNYYKNLTDEQKVKIVEAIYDYANNVAKTKVLDDFELEFNDKKIQKLQNEGLDFYKYILLKKTADYDGNGYTSNDELDKAIKKYGLTRWQKTIKEKKTKNTKTTNTLPTLKQQRAKLPTMK